MFNRNFNRSNFMSCFVAGFANGCFVARREQQYNLEPNALKNAILYFMGIYVVLRFPGDANARLNRLLGTALGITAGVLFARAMFEHHNPTPRLKM